jgi:hypothetical protein
MAQGSIFQLYYLDIDSLYYRLCSIVVMVEIYHWEDLVGQCY